MEYKTKFNSKQFFKNAHFKGKKIKFEVEEWAGYFVASTGDHKNLHIIKRYYDLANKNRLFFVEKLTDEGIKATTVSENLKIVEVFFEYDKITILN